MDKDKMTHYSIDSDLSKVRDIASQFQKFSKTEHLGDELTGQLELVLVEAVNNVIEHAYELTKGSIVDVQFEAFDTKVVITITDHGLPVPQSIREMEVSMPDIHALPEGGWGLGLIHALTDKIEHYIIDNLNVMVLTKLRISPS